MPLLINTSPSFLQQGNEYFPVKTRFVAVARNYVDIYIKIYARFICSSLVSLEVGLVKPIFESTIQLNIWRRFY